MRFGRRRSEREALEWAFISSSSPSVFVRMFGVVLLKLALVGFERLKKSVQSSQP